MDHRSPPFFECPGLGIRTVLDGFEILQNPPVPRELLADIELEKAVQGEPTHLIRMYQSSSCPDSSEISPINLVNRR